MGFSRITVSFAVNNICSSTLPKLSQYKLASIHTCRLVQNIKIKLRNDSMSRCQKELDSEKHFIEQCIDKKI